MVGNNKIIDQAFLLDLIKNQIETTPERYKGYHSDLLETIASIIQKERENLIQTAQTIRLDVKEIISLNGDKLNDNSA